MTQIVGIVYQEGILVASESQYTAGRQKTFDAEKISIIKFKNGDAIVAECGVVSTSNRAVRYFTEAAKDAEIDSEDAVSKIIESVIKKIRLEILESLQERPYSAAEQDEIFNSDNYRFGLMVAHYFKPPRMEIARPKPIPCLYKITLQDGLAERLRSYGVMGAIDRLAVFILKQFNCNELKWGGAACLAIDVLERIKDDDNTCGGKIIFATVDPVMLHQPTAAIFDGDLVKRATEKLNFMRLQHDERYKKELQAVMGEIHREDYDKYIKPMLESKEEQAKKLRENAPGFTILHQCSNCKHPFNIQEKHLSKDRNEVRCPVCGQLDETKL